MVKANLAAMRQDYTALVLIADGLCEVVRRCAACNVLTMARMASDARKAARDIASQIEKAARGAQGPVSRCMGWLDAARDLMDRCRAGCAALAAAIVSV